MKSCNGENIIKMLLDPVGERQVLKLDLLVLTENLSTAILSTAWDGSLRSQLRRMAVALAWQRRIEGHQLRRMAVALARQRRIEGHQLRRMAVALARQRRIEGDQFRRMAVALARQRRIEGHQLRRMAVALAR